MNKLFPIILVIVGGFFIFGDDIKLDSFIPSTTSEVIIERDIPNSTKEKMSGLVDIIKNSSATKEQKNQASMLWIANGDIWSISKVNVNSDKLTDYNKELLSIFSIQYPELLNAFPGFSQEVEKIFFEEFGEYPKPIDDELRKKIVEVFYGIGWAFSQ